MIIIIIITALSHRRQSIRFNNEKNDVPHSNVII